MDTRKVLGCEAVTESWVGSLNSKVEALIRDGYEPVDKVEFINNKYLVTMIKYSRETEL